MDGKRSYPIEITVNGRKIVEVLIDPHYEIKHSSSINDELILGLVKLLNGKFYTPDETKDGFQYFAADLLEFKNLSYRLVWILEDERMYIGVVNAFRR